MPGQDQNQKQDKHEQATNSSISNSAPLFDLFPASTSAQYQSRTAKSGVAQNTASSSEQEHDQALEGYSGVIDRVASRASDLDSSRNTPSNNEGRATTKPTAGTHDAAISLRYCEQVKRTTKIQWGWEQEDPHGGAKDLLIPAQFLYNSYSSKYIKSADLVHNIYCFTSTARPVLATVIHVLTLFLAATAVVANRESTESTRRTLDCQSRVGTLVSGDRVSTENINNNSQHKQTIHFHGNRYIPITKTYKEMTPDEFFGCGDASNLHGNQDIRIYKYKYNYNYSYNYNDGVKVQVTCRLSDDTKGIVDQLDQSSKRTDSRRQWTIVDNNGQAIDNGILTVKKSAPSNVHLSRNQHDRNDIDRKRSTGTNIKHRHEHQAQQECSMYQAHKSLEGANQIKEFFTAQCK
ncbi:hypothetical protein BC939DRAFT_499344 [Gamsiella multidivaricata]|uniref:uncharacterized protein n=1 Tax=Gamsiella multidivaricata TaxID=101098 RepID=UPI00221F58D5|nr:uncharacterized protein BC939DRAFT_499344 [Gamsiella multidivaricata]KAI7830631.1 hypothetical protein BC939DRAFT_499344 [Gamsiella multidivaricata]